MAKKKKNEEFMNDEEILDATDVSESEQSESEETPIDASDQRPPIQELDMEALQAAINEAKTTQASSQDEVLRARAEMENFKRRKEQEKDAFMKYANEKVIMEILPAIDSFDMALAQAQTTQNDDIKNVIIGFEYIHQQLNAALEKCGVTRIDALNKPFDPNHHQAMGKEKQEGVAPETVIKQMQAGYKLHDRVLRPAMVLISE
jgi:molecular chaperone GrpE